MAGETKHRVTDEVKEALGEMGVASGDMVAQVRDSAREVAAAVANRTPAAIAASQETVDRIVERLNGSSSDSLVLGTVFSVGVWFGLTLARAPRLTPILSVLPAMILGGVLISRRVPSPDSPRKKR